MTKNEELMDAILSGEDDPILPDGWKEGDDLFAEVSGDVDSFVADGSEEVTELETENEDGNSVANDPTTVEEAGDENQSPEGEVSPETPDGEEQVTEKPSRKLKLKVNHAEEEIDIDEMSDEDLTALLQKGRAFDAMKESENKQKYRRVYQEQIDAGMTDDVALMVAQKKAGGKTYALEDAAEPVSDFRAELAQLRDLYPDFKEIPDEVAIATAKGIPLLNAYQAYRDQQSAKTAASLKRENEVLKQNAASAAKAPVRGVTGGGNTAPKKVDNFLKGFDSDNW